MSHELPSICEPRSYPCEECGVAHTYHCGRLLLYRDPTKPEEACPDGTMICLECPVDEIGEFFTRAYDAQARRQEWEVGP